MAAIDSVLAAHDTDARRRQRRGFSARTGDDRVSSGSEPWADSRTNRGGCEAWIAAFNIGVSHQEAEDPQEPIQAWLDVKVTRNILGSPQSHQIHNTPAYSFPFIFNYFETVFCVHSFRVYAFPQILTGMRGPNAMQSRTTCRSRPVSSISSQRTSSGSTREPDRRAHSAGNRSCGF